MKKKEQLKKTASTSSAKKKVVKKVTKPKNVKTEDESYWATRSADDSRLDWRNGAGSWVDEYVASKDHPHRQLILNALAELWPFAGVLEVGCNAGPNLMRIQEQYPETQLAGIDVNQTAIEKAKELLPSPILKQGSALNLPFEDQSFDVALTDAVLMYASPEVMERVAAEINRVARKYVVLLEWCADKEGVVDYHWARDYATYFEPYGFELHSSRPLTEAEWPNAKWVSHGRLSVFRRA